MGVLAFLLDTKLGHMLIGMLCILIAGAGMYWRGHNRGWDAAVERDKAVVAACMAANERDAQTIRNLEAANRAFMDVAKADAAKLSHAVADVAAMKASGDKALAESQRRLQEVERENQSNREWAAGRVPAAVADSMRN